jgi:hypothetical protein
MDSMNPTPEQVAAFQADMEARHARIMARTAQQNADATAGFHEKMARAFRSVGETEQANRATKLAERVRGSR